MDVHHKNGGKKTAIYMCVRQNIRPGCARTSKYIGTTDRCRGRSAQSRMDGTYRMFDGRNTIYI